MQELSKSDVEIRLISAHASTFDAPAFASLLKRMSGEFAGNFWSSNERKPM